jgi:hypothetical protein
MLFLSQYTETICLTISFSKGVSFVILSFRNLSFADGIVNEILYVTSVVGKGTL